MAINLDVIALGGSNKRPRLGMKHSPGRGSHLRQRGHIDTPAADMPIMLQQTYQRLDSYGTAVRKLFTAVINVQLLTD